MSETAAEFGAADVEAFCNQITAETLYAVQANARRNGAKLSTADREAVQAGAFVAVQLTLRKLAHDAQAAAAPPPVSTSTLLAADGRPIRREEITGV